MKYCDKRFVYGGMLFYILISLLCFIMYTRLFIHLFIYLFLFSGAVCIVFHYHCCWINFLHDAGLYWIQNMNQQLSLCHKIYRIVYKKRFFVKFQMCKILEFLVFPIQKVNNRDDMKGLWKINLIQSFHFPISYFFIFTVFIFCFYYFV